MGFLHEGELYVCGRLKDMIVVRGQNIYPNDIEAFVETSVPGVSTGSVAAFGVRAEQDCEGVAVLIEARPGNALPALVEISHQVSDACQVPVRLVALVARGSIARTSSGKVSRALTQELWTRGRIQVLERYETLPVKSPEKTSDEFLQDIFRSAERCGGDHLTLEQLGLDSFALVTLSVHLEEWLERNNLDGHRLAFDVNDLRVMQSITVGQLRQLLGEASKSRPNIVKLGRLSSRAIREIVGEEETLMRNDARLHRDIRPDPVHKTASGPGILLTGATGFLGSYLLRSLLDLTACDVHVLVRAQDAEHGRNRVEAALATHGVDTGERRPRHLERIKVVVGDLAQERLGLDDAGWERLSRAVSVIYHCGAEVDYVKSYRAMRAANVLGTREILRLASSGARKRLHHISTTFVFGWCALPRLFETAYDDGMSDRDFGYAQTKWVSEQLVYEAIERGLDANVYRCSLVTASERGHFQRGDIVARVLSYMIHHRISTDALNQMSFLPVDHCAENIVAISLMEAEGPQTFHVTADDHYTIADVCSIISECFGFQFDYVNMERFAQHVAQSCGPDDELYPLKPFITRHVDRVNRMRDKRYDNRNYRTARDSCPGARRQPELLRIVHAIVEFLQAADMMPVSPLEASVTEKVEMLRELPRS